ncbi:MAG: DNA polymerase III subunit beta [Saprospiraceae bacterium]|jgi:DNA polymerase-3 subunit beta|nr:DNA polymerase III subunit beta [Candidatus Defluviibacterium haderslevense]MCC7027316.1 DNA polymerase III subunit beta [Saprospiraceae bacterium]MBK7242987.1 DNA polymerase III subunit beta [Candidatus Defluviibacterium haderslevense]MBK8243024.1 DNA polymerase III subunit beta [Candidatus Defluviibacterium haderslevense]MBL0238730.1 DNA polymerase III subunit beta [Candidatus Defluviibacterium haderslevense]
MKFVASTSALLRQLQIAAGALSANPVIPVLEDFMMTLQGNKLSIAASNLEMTITTDLEVTGQENGKIAIPGKTLLETLKSLPEQPLSFVINSETRGIEITSASGKYKLVGEKSEDFPEIETPTDEDSIEMDSIQIQKGIDKTFFAASNDEMRQSMRGININIDFNHVTFAATDAHKLVKYSFLDVESNVASSLLLTKKSMLALKGILPRDGKVKIYFGKTKAFFSFDNCLFATRLIEAKFPDFNAVIPTNNQNKMIVNREELISALRRLSIFANKTTNQIVLNIQDKSLTITAQDLDFNNEATEQLSCSFEGEAVNLGLNAKFMLEMLNVIESEQVIFEISLSTKPAIILPSEQNAGEDLLMLMVTNY